MNYNKNEKIMGIIQDVICDLKNLQKQIRENIREEILIEIILFFKVLRIECYVFLDGNCY